MDRRRVNRVKTDFLMKAWFYVANSLATRKKCDFPKLFLNAGQLARKNREVARETGRFR
jgi:hypothetical protein